MSEDTERRFYIIVGLMIGLTILWIGAVAGMAVNHTPKPAEPQTYTLTSNDTLTYPARCTVGAIYKSQWGMFLCTITDHWTVLEDRLEPHTLYYWTGTELTKAIASGDVMTNHTLPEYSSTTTDRMFTTDGVVNSGGVIEHGDYGSTLPASSITDPVLAVQIYTVSKGKVKITTYNFQDLTTIQRKQDK